MKLAYIRTSTEDQNPANQKRDILSMDSEIEEFFEDKQSAWKDNVERETFNDVKKLIKSGKVSDLYAWDIDRIYRNREKLKEFFQFCKFYNCKVHSFRQQWLEELNSMKPPFGEIMHEFFLDILGWIAEAESQKLSDRIKLAVRTDKRGRTISYKGNKWGRKNHSKRVVGEVLSLHEQGLSLREIAGRVVVYDRHGNAKNISKSSVYDIVKT